MAASIKVPADFFRPKRDFDIPDPFTRTELSRTEKVLGVKLPAAYVAVLKVRNGGRLRRTAIRLEGRLRRGVPREYTITNLPGIHPTHPYGLTQRLELARGWEVPEGLIPLNDDGHWWTCLDYRECGPRGEPPVVHVEQQIGIEFRVANSFADLLARLYRAEDDYEPAVIALDGVKVRGKRLATVLEGLGCVKHTYPDVLYSKVPLPPTWHWHKYRSFVRGSPVWLLVEKNKTYGYAPKFDERPAGHPMLCVSVRPKDEAKCLAELTAVLGSDAMLLQNVT